MHCRECRVHSNSNRHCKNCGSRKMERVANTQGDHGPAPSVPKLPPLPEAAPRRVP